MFAISDLNLQSDSRQRESIARLNNSMHPGDIFVLGLYRSAIRILVQRASGERKLVHELIAPVFHLSCTKDGIVGSDVLTLSVLLAFSCKHLQEIKIVDLDRLSR